MTYQSTGSASRVPLARASHSVQNSLGSHLVTLRGAMRRYAALSCA